MWVCGWVCGCGCESVGVGVGVSGGLADVLHPDVMLCPLLGSSEVEQVVGPPLGSRTVNFGPGHRHPRQPRLQLRAGVEAVRAEELPLLG
jgi:hypothetical protein